METEFRAAGPAGRKLLVPYVTGGYPGWEDRPGGRGGRRRRIEIGVPFSDPVMDGPVIQQASQAALEGGATPPADPRRRCEARRRHPLAVMTYYNLSSRPGTALRRRLVAAGIDGGDRADLPLEESAAWCAAADDAGIETVMLAARRHPTAACCDRRSVAASCTRSVCSA